MVYLSGSGDKIVLKFNIYTSAKFDAFVRNVPNNLIICLTKISLRLYIHLTLTDAFRLVFVKVNYVRLIFLFLFFV